MAAIGMVPAQTNRAHGALLRRERVAGAAHGRDRDGARPTHRAHGALLLPLIHRRDAVTPA